MFDPDRTDLALRIITALVCGGAIGFERQFRAHAAGMRTHALAAEGAALFAIAGILITSEAYKIGFNSADPTRVSSTVVQGIGFLAAGVIFGAGSKIKGLTTAAGLWTTAAIGVLCGIGLFDVALFATVATVIVLSIFKVIERQLDDASVRLGRRNQDLLIDE